MLLCAPLYLFYVVSADVVVGVNVSVANVVVVVDRVVGG